MKVRLGFVSNSSSSSYIITLKNNTGEQVSLSSIILKNESEFKDIMNREGDAELNAYREPLSWFELYTRLLNEGSYITVNPGQSEDIFIETGDMTNCMILSQITDDVISPTMSSKFIAEG